MPGKITASLDEMLRGVEWGEYKLGDLFYVEPYKRRFDANKVKILDTGKYPYIVRTGDNNGQRGFIEENIEYLNEGNTISFGQDTATVFYQENAYFTGDKIKILKPKNKEFSSSNALFFLTAISQPFKKFSWGDSRFNTATVEEQVVWLPVKNGKINFSFMEKFIAELEAQHIAELQAYLRVAGLTDYTLTEEEEKTLREFDSIVWDEYMMGTLFERIPTKKLPYKAGDLPKEPVGEYTLPCLTSSFRNQGLNYFVPRANATILKNVISLPSNSDVYRAYFQSDEFTVLSDAYSIRWIHDMVSLQPKQSLFTVTCINKVTDLPTYSYKTKLGGWNVVKNKYIQLPTRNGQLDYEMMEKLISAIQKLVIRDVVTFAEKEMAATKIAIAR